jgi:uncharacterized protein
MPTYKTPDVYIEEISVFPPSVAEVETAIPAFIGYTERARRREDDDLVLKPTKIYSMKEYEQFFGFGWAEAMEVTVQGTAETGYSLSAFEVNGDAPADDTLPSYLLYYAVKLFFENGGGKCYIVSVGLYDGDGAIDEDELRQGLDGVAMEDEPTLIVIPEAAHLNRAGYAGLAQAVLAQCARLQDRFGVFDAFRGALPQNDPSDVGEQSNQDAMRFVFGMNNLKYGAVYYPFVRTSFTWFVDEDQDNVLVNYVAAPEQDLLEPDEVSGTGTGTEGTGTEGTGTEGTGTEGTGTEGTGTEGTGTEGTGTEGTGTEGTGTDISDVTTLGMLRTTNTAVYNFVKAQLKERYVVMPPSGAVVGVYAAVDTSRGVWKAPANVSLAAVIEPVVRLNTPLQDSLNVDATTGKSINAIRSFAGKGTLVWGARTLAGNDNEWRYVSVRRFFNMVEESVKKSTYWAVFEPNDANTWVKVRGMIENYLTQKWREGALAGATPKDAFFVRCGLGTTMSTQDILEGRMNVEIGMAVVRPAEFIILKFSHKLQTS